MSRADDDEETFSGLDPTTVALIGKIAILGAHVEDWIYRTCDALALGDCRGASVSTAADRMKDKAKEEGGLPPWARVDAAAVVAVCSAVKSALNDRNQVIHAAYVTRHTQGVGEPHDISTGGKRAPRRVEVARLQRELDALRAANRKAVEIWVGLPPCLAPQIYDLRSGPNAPDLLVMQQDGNWPEHPDAERTAALRA